MQHYLNLSNLPSCEEMLGWQDGNKVKQFYLNFCYDVDCSLKELLKNRRHKGLSEKDLILYFINSCLFLLWQNGSIGYNFEAVSFKLNEIYDKLYSNNQLDVNILFDFLYNSYWFFLRCKKYESSHDEDLSYYDPSEDPCITGRYCDEDGNEIVVE